MAEIIAEKNDRPKIKGREPKLENKLCKHISEEDMYIENAKMSCLET